jgi:hypothetical protein
VIHSNDHEPAHIHVVGKGCEAKIQLEGERGLELVWQVGFGYGDMRKVMMETEARRKEFLARWREIHGG